jgi:hypothetical protein
MTAKTCKGKFKCNDKVYGWGRASFPPIANCAMDEAPGEAFFRGKVFFGLKAWVSL